MLQFKEIKKKHLGYLYTRLPSLQILDSMNSRAVMIGWLFLTIGVVVGVIWVTQARAVLPDDPNIRAMVKALAQHFAAKRESSASETRQS